MSCTHSCIQGRKCDCRPYTLTTTNSDDSDLGYSGYVKDLVYAGVQLSAVLVLLAVALAGFGYGLRGAGWI